MREEEHGLECLVELGRRWAEVHAWLDDHARDYFPYSHKQLHGKHTGDLHEMIHQVGDNWDKHPAFFKRGQYIRRVTRKGKVTSEEMQSLPEKHEARRDPDFEFERSSIERVLLPPLSKIMNRPEALFHGAEVIELCES